MLAFSERIRRTRRHRDDPDRRWHCCAHWPRTLAHKWTARGCVLGELATTPRGGECFTPCADAFLGELWERIVPDRV